MSVIFLDEARALRRMPRSKQWTSSEMAELTHLYRAKREHDGAIDFAIGTTDFEDPQFYVLSGVIDQPCNVCVSRLMKNGRSWYVAEDGSGHIEEEGACLRTLIVQITKRSLKRWHALIPILAYFAQQFLSDGADPQEVAFATKCLMAIA